MRPIIPNHRPAQGRVVTSVTTATMLGLAFGWNVDAAAQTRTIERTIQVSTTGVDGDANRDTVDPFVAYNPHRGEYLVAWSADGLATDNETEIFAQRLGPTGSPRGAAIRVSVTGAEGDAARGTFSPAIAYNERTREYLVTWRADALATDEEFEVFGQRLSATGALLGENFRLSTTGADGDANRDAFPPSVASNARSGEYLVVWSADSLATDEDFEIFAQRVGPRGALLGPAVRVSVTGPEDDAARSARQAGVVYNPRKNEYLVTWVSDHLNDDENEIFAQRLGAQGTLLGTNFRVSTTGTDGDPNRDAFPPSVTVNSDNGKYLVIWSADALATDDDYEIFAQRINANGTLLGRAVQVSETGSTGDPTRQARQANAAYNPKSKEFLITWLADGLATDDENEVFAQRLAANGSRRGGNFRVSYTGTDGDAARDADGFPPGVVYNAKAGRYLVVWTADALATDDEFEVFAKQVPGAP